MYLNDFDTIINQIIPPHWRDQWQEQLLRSCCEPMRKTYNEFYLYTKTIPDLVNLNSQVMVMETNLNRIAGHILPLISISDALDSGKFIVNVPSADPAIPLITAYLEKYSLAGRQYTISEY